MAGKIRIMSDVRKSMASDLVINARSDSPSEHGINLMACYFIVHYHGGQIEAESERRAGAEPPPTAAVTCMTGFWPPASAARS